MATTALGNFIDGARSTAADGAADLVSPVTEEVYATAIESGPEQVDEAFQAARTAFSTWRDSTPAERQLALFRIADAIEARADEFAALESQDTGKPLASLVEDEILVSVDQIRFFAGAARVLEGRSAGEYMRDHTSFIRREPIGVIGQVTPWNYPLNMATWKFAPAIAAGNAVVLKPSETTPSSTLLLAEVAAEFLPPGVLNVITGGRATGAAMVENPIPAMVSITGSVRAGMAVAQAASTDLKRVHLELGGKAPVIVFDDADLGLAVEGIVTAGYFNAGQDCTAATRILVQDGVHDEFVAALAEYARDHATTGAPDQDVLYGPVNSRDQLDRVAGFVDRLPDHARLDLPGGRHGETGWFWDPTIVSGLRQDDEAVQQEIFGPVQTVQRFTDEAQAIAWANDVQYGLSSSVWTSDHGTAMRVSRELDFGCVWINTHIPLVAEMPHGGFKHSGYGKDLSMYGFEDYTRIKHVMSFLGAPAR